MWEWLINWTICTTIFWFPLIFILIQPSFNIKIHDNNMLSIFIIMYPSKSGTGGWNVSGCWPCSSALFHCSMQCQRQLCPNVVKRDAIGFLPQPHSTIKLHLQHTHTTWLLWSLKKKKKKHTFSYTLFAYASLTYEGCGRSHYKL